MSAAWKNCLTLLEPLFSAQEFNTWIKPLRAQQEKKCLFLFAPNEFIKEKVCSSYLEILKEKIIEINKALSLEVEVDPIVEKKSSFDNPSHTKKPISSNLNANFLFKNFIEGKSNQVARAAALQTSKNPGSSYNPLFLCGGVGLGKTHLAHAIGNDILKNDAAARVIYLHSERFVDEMVRALQNNAMNQFKNRYRNLSALLIDDIQFFAGKERSQEELFHTFNALIENNNQIVLTCDRYPKELPGLEERLKSRFSWGLTISIEPPELETRVAILRKKAAFLQIDISHEVAFFVAKNFHSNVRELEGALNRMIAHSRLTQRPISLDLAEDALKDLLMIQDRQVNIDNIQKTVASYYKIRLSDLLSGKRSRSLVRPRQIAMSLSKELTNHSLPEIGRAFGGRDHTTVIHAHKKTIELRKSDSRIEEDYKNLVRILNV